MMSQSMLLEKHVVLSKVLYRLLSMFDQVCDVLAYIIIRDLAIDVLIMGGFSIKYLTGLRLA